MSLEPVQFGGLVSLEADELIPFEAALQAHNCILDDNTITGREGYRNAMTGKAAVGSNTPQLLARFRPSLTSARTVAVVGGAVHVITDPSSETAEDGSSSSLGAVFGASANISAAQLGRYLYIGTDEATVAMRRMDSAYALSSLETIPQGAKPSLAAFSPLAWTLFKDLAAPTVSGCVMQTNANTGMGGLHANWRAFTRTNNGNDDPLVDASAYFDLGADKDWSGCEWLAVTVSPHDGGGNNTGQQVEVYASIDSAGVPANFISIGTTYDVPAVGGSPNLLFCSLLGIKSSDRAKIRYIQFKCTGVNGGKFLVYGFVPLPAKPLDNPTKYYVTFQNDVTGQESAPTEALEVTIRDSDKLASGALTYPNCYMTSGSPKNDAGDVDLLSTGNQRVFNREAHKDMPDLADLGALVTVQGTTPTSTVPTKVRLWKDTQEGRRLVNTITYPGSASAYSIPDPGGDGILANTKYRPGGTPPPCYAMAAWANRIVVAGVGSECNRIYVSSYVAPDQTSDPFVQFPKIPLEEADGWAFDVASTTAVQTLQIIEGDAIYLLTNEFVSVIYDLGAPLNGAQPAYYKILQRGVLGRSGGIWAENALFWAAYDGVYMCVNRSNWDELTQEQYRLYVDWLQPDSSVVLSYRDRKLFVENPTNQRFMRYDFRRKRWTTGERAHAVVRAAMWQDAGKQAQLWYLTSDRLVERLQRGATSDDGTAIPDWEYSTGYAEMEGTARVKRLVADTTGPVLVTVCKDAENNGELARSVDFSAGRTDESGPADLAGEVFRLRMVGASTAKLRRLKWELFGFDKRGA